jgi:hypothetical protein
VISHPFKVGFSDSMSVVFLMGAAIMVVGFIVVLLLPEIPLADGSAAQARAAESEADAAGAGAPPVAVTSLADAHPARTEPAAGAAPDVGSDGPAQLDPDADQRGRHNADGHEGELRVPADAHAGEGRHDTAGPEDPDRTVRPTAGD